MKFVPAAAKAEGVPAHTQLQALNDIILYHNTAQLVSMDQRKFQIYCEEMQKKCELSWLYSTDKRGVLSSNTGASRVL